MVFPCNAQDRLFCSKNKRKMKKLDFTSLAIRESTLVIKLRMPTMITVAIVVLAAGKASRMNACGEGQNHKLLALFDGVPLIRRMVLTSLNAKATSTTVVTGHRNAEIEACLTGLPIRLCFNGRYEDGMASSIIAALRQPEVSGADGALILLADMPKITADHLDQLIAAFQHAGGGVIVRATADGKSGNPVILPSTLYPSVLTLKGDRGAKSLIEASGLSAVDVEIGRPALVDVDTPADVVAEGGVL
jgi:molybdenum cofactor cytidylyltransferase